MEAPEIAHFARNFSVMVRIQGPDPKGLKMRRHAFHLHRSGITTLSASGLLLPKGCLRETPPILDHVSAVQGFLDDAVVITSASVLEPFLIVEQRNRTDQEFDPKLITGAQIDVLVEGKKPGSDSSWLSSKILALIDVSASSVALQSIIGAQAGSFGSAAWEAGWSLPPLISNTTSTTHAFQRKVGNDIGRTVESSRNYANEEPSTLSGKMKSMTRLAFLGVSPFDVKGLLHLDISKSQKRGDLLLVVGSPFGVLSPLHFLNSISVGSVANCCPPGNPCCSLAMADIRCLPGMEGGPVFDGHACLSGILTQPLRQKGGSAEIQLVITWDAIATALCSELQNKVQRAHQELTNSNHNAGKVVSLSSHNISMIPLKFASHDLDYSLLSKPSLEKAISSIVLVTVGVGAWASGVLINNQGLILTNAHILEPWRFGRTSSMGLMDKVAALNFEHEMNSELGLDEKEGKDLLPSQLGDSNSTMDGGHITTLLSSSSKSYNKISVRLDYLGKHTWIDAKVVYISRGAMDVALLQLETVPTQLCGITPQFVYPSMGSNVHVIGHGLLGPRSDLSASVFTGVLAKVIVIDGPFNVDGSGMLETEALPVMLQTTAAVHPGASGGAVVNSDGHMIGLVTSNARHGGGTIVPHLNFSIPCAALRPVFKFSDEHDLSILQVMDKPHELLSSVWSLMPPPTPRLQSPLEKDEGRGSRFAKFLAERQAEIPPLNEHVQFVKEKFPHDVSRRSKL